MVKELQLGINQSNVLKWMRNKKDLLSRLV